MNLRELFNQSLNTNLTSPHIVTSRFAPLLIKSKGRIIFVTSGTAPLNDTPNTDLPFNKIAEAGWPKKGMQNGYPFYRSGKTGLNMLMREWYRKLHADGVKVFSISPGRLATGLGHGSTAESKKESGAEDPAVGGQIMAETILGKRDADAGYVVNKTGRQTW